MWLYRSNKIIWIIWFTFFTNALISPSLAESDKDSRFSFKLTPTQVIPGQRAVLEIRLKTGDTDENDEANQPVIRDDLLHQSKNVAVIEQNVRKEDDNWLWTYELVSYEPGLFPVAPVEIKYQSSTFSTESLLLLVDSTRGANDKDLRDDFGEVPVAYPWKTWIWWAVLFVAAVIFFALLNRWVPRLWQRRKEFIKLPKFEFKREPKVDPLAWLRGELVRIRAAKSRGIPTSVLVDDIDGVIREFYHKKLKVPAQSWTTKELQAKLKEQKIFVPLQQIFSRSELYKFCQAKMENPDSLFKDFLEKTEKSLCGN